MPSRFSQRLQLRSDALELAFDFVLASHDLFEPRPGFGGPPFELADRCLRLRQRVVAAAQRRNPLFERAQDRRDPCRLGRRPLDLCFSASN